MTDNEIIKALECLCDVNIGDCSKCPVTEYEGDCAWVITEHALGLINRQKAEIEALKRILSTYNAPMTDCIHYDEDKECCKLLSSGYEPYKCTGECFDYDNRKDDDDED